MSLTEIDFRSGLACKSGLGLQYRFVTVALRLAIARCAIKGQGCAESCTISPIWRSVAAIGLDLRQTRPTVRVGAGWSKRVMQTGAERVSTPTAMSGISVTPMPAPTI